MSAPHLEGRHLIECENELAWLRMRQKYITASEAGATTTPPVSRYYSMFSLFHSKRREIEPPPAPDYSNPAEQWKMFGHATEPGTAQVCATLTRRVLHDVGEYTIIVDDDGTLSCTPDYIINPVEGYDVPAICSLSDWHPDPADGPGICQVKAVNEYMYSRDWAENVPLWIQVQNQVEMWCAGFRWGSIVANVGNSRLLVFDHEINMGLIEIIRERSRDLLDAIQDGIEPPPDGHDQTRATLKDLFTNVEDVTLVLPGDAQEHWVRYREGAHQATEGKRVKQEEENWFRHAMGSAHYAVIPDVGRANCHLNGHGSSRTLRLPTKANAAKTRKMIENATAETVKE